jgi:hypothetical protein
MAECVDCGQLRAACRRVPCGVVCQGCDRRRGGRDGECTDCGNVTALRRGRCVACRLRQNVATLRAGADPAAGETLAPYLTMLTASPNPASTLRWMELPSFTLVRELLAGSVPITHAALDTQEAPPRYAGKSVAFLRAALVHCGVLEPRNEASVAFARFIDNEVGQIDAGPDRAHVRAYATWSVAHRLEARPHAGE